MWPRHLKENVKKILRWFIGFVAALLILIVSLIGTVDDSVIIGRGFYRRTIHRLDTFRPALHRPQARLRAGWAKINITPREPMPMAGYAPRDHFDSVHDSVYIRILAIDNGGIQCFLISADLLLFPPALESKILQHQGGRRFLYFTATHAHSSLGGWDDSTVGNLILGSYNARWLDSLAAKVNNAMDFAAAHLRPASVNYFETDASEYVENRLDSHRGLIDGMIRGLKILRDDGSKGLFVSYSAHPTNISHLSLALSGDYPASLVKAAERTDYEFAMFASGMVGSHRVKGISETGFLLCDTLASRLYRKVKSATLLRINDSTISTAIIPVDYGPSQLHLLPHFKVRDWVFKSLFRKLQGDIRYLKIGDVIMLGAPCDFSGEIFTRDGLGKFAASQRQKLFITSFNGDYVGYITYDDHYGHSGQEEVMAMNWVGPHFGGYYSEIVKKIVEGSK